MALRFTHQIFTKHLLYDIQSTSYIGLLPGEGIREHSQQQEMFFPISPTGRNVVPFGFKNSSRNDDKTFPNPVHRSFIMSFSKESHEYATNNLVAYFN